MPRKIKTKEEWIQHILSVSNKNDKMCWVFEGRKHDGYGIVCTGGRKEKKDLLVHRLIYEHFYGPIPDNLCVCHHCDNPPCVNPDHLFLGTNRDNVKDKVKKGRAHRTIGERSGMCKLTREQVLAIRSDERRQVDIAADYGVAKSTICMIKNKTSRKYE